MLGEIQVSEVANLPTASGEFYVQAFKEVETGKEHLAIFSKELSDIPVVRVHSECLTGDALGSLKCDCGDQLDYALNKIYIDGGVVLYLRQEGRDIGLLNKINAYNLQDQGMDTVEANHQLGFESDLRRYDIAEYMLKHLNITKIKLLTNNPKKIKSLKEVEIVERVPIIMEANPYNRGYLNVKKRDMGHLL